MSVRAFPEAIGAIRLSTADRECFPRWVQQYADFFGLDEDEPLPVDATHLITFLRQLRDQRVHALQRLQAAKALECYRAVVLKAGDTAPLEDQATLQQITAEDNVQLGTVWQL